MVGVSYLCDTNIFRGQAVSAGKPAFYTHIETFLAQKAVLDLSKVFFVPIMMYAVMCGVLMDIYGVTVSKEAGDVKDYCNEIIERILELTNKMIALADEGDSRRQDVGCGVLFGTLRDSAYKLKSLAEMEIAEHKRQGKWSGVHSA